MSTWKFSNFTNLKYKNKYVHTFSATPSKKKDQEKSQKPPVPKPRTRSRIDSTQDTPQQPAKHQLPGNNEFKTPLKPPHSNQKPPHSNRKTPQKLHPQESPRVLRSHTREIPEQKVPRMSRSATRTVKNRFIKYVFSYLPGITSYLLFKFIKFKLIKNL